MKKHCSAIALAVGVLLAAVFTLGCRPPEELGEEFYDDGEFYEIEYYMPVMLEGVALYPKDMDLVVAEVNKIIEPVLNARLKVYPISYYLYNEQMPLKIGSNEKFDLMYTSPSINHYFTNIDREAFLPLDWMIDEYAPESKKQVPDWMWEQARVDGKIYGMINMQIMPRFDCAIVNDVAVFDEFLAEDPAYSDYDHTDIYQCIEENNLHPYDLLEEYVRWLKLHNKGLGGKMGAIEVFNNLQTRYHWDDLGTGMYVPGVVAAEDDAADGLTVFNQFETEEFVNDIKRAASYYDEGLIPQSIKNDSTNGVHMPIYDVVPMATWKPNDIRTNDQGRVAMPVRLGNGYYYTSYILGSMTAISSTSKNPARVMKFLEMLRTDVRLLNLLVFGIEGKHFTIEDPVNRPLAVTEIKNQSGYNNSYMTWAYGTEFLDGFYYLDKYADDVYQQNAKINEEGIRSAVLGFNFDIDAEGHSVSTYVANCNSVATTYLAEFQTGKFGLDKVEEKYQEFLTKLKAAGADKVVAEKQRQLNLWLASR